MAHEWFVVRAGREVGPVSAQELKGSAANGELVPDDLVRRGDQKAPIRAGSVKGLFGPPEAAPRPAEHPDRGDKPSRRGPSDDRPSSLADRWGSLTSTGKAGVAAGGAALVCMFFCCGGLMFLGALSSNAGKGRGNGKGEQAAQEKTDSGPGQQPRPADPPKDLTLADGRVPMDALIAQLKRLETLELHTPKDGSDTAGTPVEQFNLVIGEKCRMHVGGREAFGQNVSAVLLESAKDKQVAGVVLGTPFDFSRSPTRGNELTSIIAFTRSILPEAEIRKMVGEEGARLAYGNESAPRTHGKASITIGYNPTAKEFRVTILVGR